jgi:hypothetical protein
MIRAIKIKHVSPCITVLLMGVYFLCSGNAHSGEVSPTTKMPIHWKVTSDYMVPAEKVNAMSIKLGARLRSVRNTVYDVNGKRVQLNVIVTPDNKNVEKLMTKLRSMKSEEGLLQKGLIVYEFVGQNDVLPVIKEGRKHLDSM